MLQCSFKLHLGVFLISKIDLRHTSFQIQFCSSMCWTSLSLEPVDSKLLAPHYLVMTKTQVDCLPPTFRSHSEFSWWYNMFQPLFLVTIINIVKSKLSYPYSCRLLLLYTYFYVSRQRRLFGFSYVPHKPPQFVYLGFVHWLNALYYSPQKFPLLNYSLRCATIHSWSLFFFCSCLCCLAL